MDSKTRHVLRVALILVGAYLACQMIADITAVKMVSILGVAIPGGTFVYAATFTLRDAVHKRLGKRIAQLAVLLAGVINIGMAAYLYLTTILPWPPFWVLQDAYAAILGIVPTIVAASIIAELVAELLDTELYQFAANTFARRRSWPRIIFSNLISTPIDSLIFAGMAFYVLPSILGGETMPPSALWSMVLGQTIFKWIVATIVLPLGGLGGVDMAAS